MMLYEVKVRRICGGYTTGFQNIGYTTSKKRAEQLVKEWETETKEKGGEEWQLWFGKKNGKMDIRIEFLGTITE